MAGGEGAGECSGRQGFVSLSVGNQVSGPVGRPLSISVLLAIYNTRRARVVISRSRPSSPLFSLSASSPSVPSCCNSTFSLSRRLPGESLLLRRSISAATGKGMVMRVRQREGNSNGERERDSDAKSYRNGRGIEAELPTRANRASRFFTRERN